MPDLCQFCPHAARQCSELREEGACLGGPPAEAPTLDAAGGALEQDRGAGLPGSGLVSELQADSSDSESPQIFLSNLLLVPCVLISGI